MALTFAVPSLRRAPVAVGVLVAVTVALTVVYTISVVPGMPERPGSIPFWDTWVYNAACAGAALICLARALLVAAERGAWLAMSAALVSSAAGSVAWSLALADDADAVYVPFADALLLGFYPLAYTAIVLLVRARARHFHRSMWLDGLVSGLAVAALSAAVAFDALVSDTGGDPMVVAVNLAYPIADLLLITLVVGIFGTGWRPGRAWLMLGAGLLVNSIADTLFLLQAASGSYVEGTLLDALWLSAVVGMGLAAWQPMSERPLRIGDWRVLAIPSLSTVVAVAVLTSSALRDGHRLAVGLASAAVLASVLRTALTFREVRQLAETRHQAITDDLTGMPNRRALGRCLQEAIGAGRPTALLLIDLDGFKELNDTLGHHVGDLLLAQLGARLAHRLRPTDLLARLGGDEFAVVMADTADPGAATAGAERLQACLHEPFVLDGIPIQIDASIGIARYPADAGTAVDLLKHADVAMYQAKRDGGGIAAYQPERDDNSRDRLVLLGELRAGIPRGELVLHFQPQVDLVTGRISGLEALVRWQHPDHGLLHPAAFLPSVEQTTVMASLTARVLEDVIDHAARWTGGALDVPVAVNVAAPNLLDVTFADTVADLLRTGGIAPERLRIEVTENAVMGDADRALAVLERVRALGVSISIDDFGTGHSSLARLKALPVDELKIDKSFVLRMHEDDRDAAIVEAAVTLARRLALSVVAEGVETSAAWNRLRQMGCDHVQGYVVTRPLPLTELEAWSRAWAASRTVAGEAAGAQLLRVTA